MGEDRVQNYRLTAGGLYEALRERVWRRIQAMRRSRRRSPVPSGADDGRRAAADDSSASCPIAATNRHDVVCFPVIDWDFRFQRPQQLMLRFARAGHRVFYLAQHFRPGGAPYEVRRKAANVYEVSLRGPARNVYQDSLDADTCTALFDSLDALRRDLSLGATASIVQLPFWWPLARRMRERRFWPAVYDCMDHHAGFSSNHAAMLEHEEELLSSADLVVASSTFLERKALTHNASVVLVRNACDYPHFDASRYARTRDGRRPVVGYFGAISEWFDVDLVADLVRKRPDWDFVLVGSTWGADVTGLAQLANVCLPGEKPYAEIPRWLAGFDVAFIPFRRTLLTEAADPVKAYEILAAGTPLVTVPLPELRPMAPLVRLASSPSEFARELEAALADTDPAVAECRRAFARENTWERRFEILAPAVARTFPKASIVVVTFNNVALTRACLESIDERTEWPHFEVIAVDNASTDGTRDYLRQRARERPTLRVVLNDNNRGFAAACNQGLRQATGEVLFLLNNDTVVSRGWATALMRHLAADPTLGMVGPVTNEIGNEAKVGVGYRSLAEMPAWALAWARAHDGETFPISMLAMFCAALRRDTLAQVGLLDERFAIGMFEDDDYAYRLRQAGYGISCARDAFVHHIGSAAFKLLGPATFQETFERNRLLYQNKWGEMWEPPLSIADRGRIAGLRAELATLVAEAGVPAERVVVFLPSIGWSTPLVQRPHHLAGELARQGYLVVFDCSGSVIDDFAGFLSLERNFWLYKGPRGVLENLDRPILWSLPYNTARGVRYRSARVVYDVIDHLSVFPYDQAALRAQHERSLDTADLVLCAAQSLLREVVPVRPDAIYAPNAVEYDRFACPADIKLDPMFQAVLAAGRPIAGYYGAIARWLDVDLLVAIAQRRRDWSFVIIGHPLADAPPLAELTHLPNVTILSPKPYPHLPTYLARFTAALIPFRISAISDATSPLKMYEYFAGGKPVIATALPECAAHEDVAVVRTCEEFSRALDDARTRAADPAFQARLRERARQNTWTVRVRMIAERLAELGEASSRIAPAASSDVSPTPVTRSSPRPFRGLGSHPGRCNVCGTHTEFSFVDPLLYRESLTCRHCLTTSRYRSIARGILRATGELADVHAESLAALAGFSSPRRLVVYDTQRPFVFENNAYPVPDLLARCSWVEVHVSEYRPDEPRGKPLGPRTTNQDLEQLTFPDASFDIVITSDVMEHVRCDDRAHREILRVLAPGGVYLFTVPHVRDQPTQVRVRVTDPADPSRDEPVMPLEYHGDANSPSNRALAFRAYGSDLDVSLRALGFEVEYTKRDFPEIGILNTELFYCRLAAR